MDAMRGVKVLFTKKDKTEAVGILSRGEWANVDKDGIQPDENYYIYVPDEESFLTIKGRYIQKVINRKEFDEFAVEHYGMTPEKIRYWLLRTFDRIGLGNGNW